MLRTLFVAAFLFPLTVHGASPCTSSFEEYLSAFQRDPLFQQEHRQYPLRYSFLDTNAEPEPRAVKRRLSAAQAMKESGIGFPSLETEKAKGLERTVKNAKKGTYVVRFDKPDSGVFSIEFHFSRVGNCWRLVEVNDFSL